MEAVTALQAELANLQGRMAQIEIDLDTSRLDGERERKAAEAARTELAKSLLRLEAMPRLEADLASLARPRNSEQIARQGLYQGLNGRNIQLAVVQLNWQLQQL